MRRAAVAALVVGLTVAVVPASHAAQAPESPPYRIVWDDFRDGFVTSGPDAKWTYQTIGPYSADDGVTTTSRRGLKVVSSGRNPRTGEPAFVRTIGQEDENGSGLPGSFDHMKWLAYTNHKSAQGLPGFDAEPGRELTCETWLSGRTFGTRHHPFGNAVPNADDDLRLASSAMSVIDPETLLVFDFFLSNERIYAFYERLPYARETQGNYAAFVYAIPVGRRSIGDQHHFRISYDRDRGVARWLVDDREVLRVDRLGHRLDRRYLMLDHGGVETDARPRQLNCGLGMYSILDGAVPRGQALVRLSNAPNFYYRTTTGEPDPQTFLDDESRESNRLFGQGAALTTPRYVISSLPGRR